MFQRTLLFLLALTLPFFAGGVGGSVQADGSGIDPSTLPGFTGLPDLESNSGQFLVLSGSANASLNGEAGGDGRTILRLTFSPDEDVRIFLFDADAAGNWDQRVDEQFVLNNYGALYRLFPDPDGDVADALINDIAPALPPEAGRVTADLDVVEGTLFAPRSTDEEWCPLFDAPGAAAAMGADGRYHYTLEAFLVDAEGFELTGFKVGFNGTYLLPQGATLGFVGGVVDARTPPGTEKPQTFDPIPDILPGGNQGSGVNTFVGTFRFPFNPCRLCDDLVIMEADADWNAPIDVIDLMPTGNPPDDGGRYFVSGVGIRDASDFRIPLGAADIAAGHHGLLWEIQDPASAAQYDSLLAPLGHPSETAPAMGDPFQSTALMGSLALMQANPGIWTFEWRGADARNSIFIRAADGDFGTTPCVCQGRLFCDDNGNGTYDQGEMVLPGLTVVVTHVATGTSVQTTSDVDGRWAVEVPASGELTVDVPDSPYPNLTGGGTLPLTFDSCDPDLLEKEIPFICTGSVSGHVYRETRDQDRDCNGIYEPMLGEAPIPGVTVILRPTDPAGADLMTTTDADGFYVFMDVATPGEYEILLVPGTGTPPIDDLATTTGTPETIALALTAGESSEGNDFFRCPGAITVEVFRGLVCDNQREDPPAGQPLANVDVALDGPEGPFMGTTDANGEVTFFNLLAGTYTMTIDGGQPELFNLEPAPDAAM
ncbi:MAG: MSCRAMM family protein, partial [Planctomycetota bacterium]